MKGRVLGSLRVLVKGLEVLESQGFLFGVREVQRCKGFLLCVGS